MQAPESNAAIPILQEYIDAINKLKWDKSNFESLELADRFEREVFESVEFGEAVIINNSFDEFLGSLFQMFDTIVSTAVSDAKALKNNSSYNSVLFVVGLVNRTKSKLIEALGMKISQVSEFQIRPGDRQAFVKELQQWLTILGYSNTIIDGVWGPATQRAIINYKKDRDLPATPDVDGALLERLEDEAKSITEQKETPATLLQSSRKKTVKKTSQQQKTQYWLLKLNPDNWPISTMKIGDAAWYNLASESLEVFNKVKENDKILGYAWEPYGKIVCVFNVTRAAYMDGKYGHIILMQVSEVCSPHISITDFIDTINFAEQLRTNSIRIISISERDYNTVINTKPKSKLLITKKSYHATLTTEGNHAETDDKLEFDNDITSLASVISLKDVKPPLAIGLFGNWGSGKSFFMEKLSGKINEFTQSGSEGMVKNVVQVKFNSWHYSDANLWACLITEIFDELYKHSVKEHKQGDLKKLSHSLHVMGLQKEDAEKKKQYLEDKVEQLENERKEERRKLQHISWIQLLKKVLNDEHVKRDLDKLSNGSIDAIWQHKSEIEKHVNKAKGFGKLLSYAARSMLDFKDGRWPLVLLIVAIVFSISSLFNKDFKILWDAITLEAASYVTFASTAIAQFIDKFRVASKRIENLMSRLDSLKKTLDSDVPPGDENLQNKKNELVEIDNALKDLNKIIDETQRKIDDIKTGKRLLEFIESRSKDEGYTSQLGMVSWIRRDLKRLDELLREQYEANLTEKRKEELDKLNEAKVDFQIDRIVLYIDDLDRCKEDVVVKVLEAVHLLLAFPLFVVVVGVDPRWLNNALAKQYEAMFKNNNGNDGNHQLHQHVATTYDYLEKIFQVPFALKPINKTGQGDLVAYLLRNEMEAAKKEMQFEPDKNHPINIHKEIGEDENPDPTITFTPDVNIDDIPGKSLPGSEDVNAKTGKAADTVTVREPLTFAKAELECMQRMSPIYGHTPRGINRYVNIYRIIKSHPGLKKAGEYDEDEFVPILFTLAIIVGYPVEAKKFIDEMAKAKDEELLNAVLVRVGNAQFLQDMVKQCLNEAELNMPCEPFRRNLELISRFSFRTIMC